MNDPIQMENIILEREKRYIGLTENISSDLFNVLSQTTPAIVASLFKKKNPNTKQIHSHDTSIKCAICSSEFTIKALTIAQVQDRIKAQRNGFGSLCDTCQKESDRFDREEEERKKLDREKAIENNTKCMIKHYLNPNNVWKTECTHKNRFHDITYYTVNDTIIKEYIRQMEYSLFLQTPYWKAIAQEVRIRAKFKCKQCENSENLAVHHTTYENHGNEHNVGFFDLICLCDKCHKKAHNIKDK